MPLSCAVTPNLLLPRWTDGVEGQSLGQAVAVERRCYLRSPGRRTRQGDTRLAGNVGDNCDALIYVECGARYELLPAACDRSDHASVDRWYRPGEGVRSAPASARCPPRVDKGGRGELKVLTWNASGYGP